MVYITTNQELNEAVAKKLGLKSGYTSEGILFCGEFGRKPFDPATNKAAALWALEWFCGLHGYTFALVGEPGKFACTFFSGAQRVYETDICETAQEAICEAIAGSAE